MNTKLLTAEDLWKKYQDWLKANLPSQYAHLVAHYVDERKELPCTIHVPIFAGQIFGITDREFLTEVGITHMLFDHFTHVLDDLTDESGEDQKALRLHLSHTLLAAGLYRAAKMPRSEQVYSYLQSAFEGERDLWRHHGHIIEYNENDFLQIGKRGSLAKTAVALCAGKGTMGGDVLQIVERAMDYMLVAVQLADDLVDWKEDLRDKIYTYPLTSLGLEISDLPERPVEEIETLLVTTGVANKTLELIQKYILDGIGLLEKAGADDWINHLLKFQETLRTWEDRLKHYNPHVPSLVMKYERESMFH